LAISLSTKGTEKLQWRACNKGWVFLRIFWQLWWRIGWDEWWQEMWQYEFPESFIKIQAVWHQCWLKGTWEDSKATRKVILVLRPYHVDYTTIFKCKA